MTTDRDDCHLCGGTGEVSITPYGQPDEAMDVFGCPACIQADRDEAERQNTLLRAALEAIADPAQVASHGDPVVLREYARAAVEKVGTL